MATQLFYCIEMTHNGQSIGGVIYTLNAVSTAGKTVFDSYYQVTPANSHIPAQVIMTPAGNMAMMMQKNGQLMADPSFEVVKCWTFHADPDSNVWGR